MKILRPLSAFKHLGTLSLHRPYAINLREIAQA